MHENRMNGKIVVTGAGGLIGSSVLASLVKNSRSVVGIYRTLPQNIFEEHVCIDLSKKNILNKLSHLLNTSVIVHCAAIIPKSFEYSNDIATQNRKIDESVLNFCEKNRCHLIYFSGTSIYGQKINGKTLDENASLFPTGDYVKEKLEMEKAIQRRIPRHHIYRVSAPYGPKQRSQTVLRLFIESVVRGEDIFYLGDGGREQDFTHVSDVAAAVEAALLNPLATGIYNIASGQPVSMKTLGEMVIKCVPGTKSRLLPKGSPDPQGDFRPRFSIEKARNFLGWFPKKTLTQGISEWVAALSEGLV